ncbi:MAG: hypothetical protein JWP91_3171 [Fibrobacteres bacterium]|nr:hypothetical protein [Fibrobacterota bacterium]
MFVHVVFRFVHNHIMGSKGRVLSRLILFALVLGGAARAENFFWNPSVHLLNGGGEVQKSGNWSQYSNGGGAWPKSGFDDDFTSDALNANWKFRDNDNDGTTGSFSLTAAADKLTLTGRGNDIWFADNQYTAVWRDDITGNFDVSVQVVSQSNSYEWAKAGILIYDEFGNPTAGGCFAVVVTPQNGIKIQFDSTGTQGEFESPGGPGVAPLVPVFPVWLRAARKGGVFYGYYKTSQNAPWTLLGFGSPQSAAANSQIGLFATSHNLGVSTTVVFDDFQANGNITAANMDMSFSGITSTAQSNALLTANLSAQSLDMNGYTGAFSFGTSTLTLSGNADFGTTATLNAGTGTLAFNSASATQLFSPLPGAIHPAISKSGNGTVQITNRPLVAGVLTMTGGMFDLGSRTNEFAGLSASGGAFRALGTGDTLIVKGDANFSGVTAMPATGNVQIRSQSTAGAGKNLVFTPGNAAFPNLYLWAIGSTFPARITTAPGTLQVKGALILRDELGSSGLQGILDFRANNTNVAADGDILRAANGSAGTPTQQLLMGNGTWTAKGNVTLSLQNSGSADNSNLDMAAASPASQTLSVTGGSIGNVRHPGTGTLSLGAPLVGKSLAQSAGTLNLAGNNVNVSGNLTVTNGNASTFANLGGRDLGADGNIALTGQSGNLLNLNPGSAWTIHAGGTLDADFAAIAKSAVTGAQDGKAASNCTNGSGNSRWVFAPPSITVQPKDVTVSTGAKAEFTVAATGAPTLAFAWRKRPDATVLSTDAVFTIASAAASDSGALYYCAVTNANGATESGDAKLNVNDPAKITAGPVSASFLAGSVATFTVSAKGSAPLAYKWKRKGDTATVASGSTLTFNPVLASQNGTSWYCIVSNPYGTDTSPEAVLTVNTIPTITVQPLDVKVATGREARFTVTAAGSGTLKYEWRRKGDAAVISTAAEYVLALPALSDSGALFQCTVINDYGQALTREAKLTVGVIPVITLEPQDTSVLAGKPAAFRVRAIGSGPLGYQWQKAGTPGFLAGDSVLALASVAPADSGASYFCIVANSYGSDTSFNAALKVNRPAVVTREPRDTAVVAGQKASFSVGAAGSGALEYQWRRKGDTTVVSRDSTLALGATVMGDNASLYSCTVINAYGQAATREAKLTVVQGALITREPADIFVGKGKKAVFTVGAIGAQPVAFKWRRRGSATILSTDSTFALDTAKLSDDGAIFTVIVSNAYGADTSRDAKLTVTVCDSVFQALPETLTVDEGQPALLKGKAACSQGFSWSVVSGPAPKILDPEVESLIITAPRVSRDTVMVYRFTAVYGTNEESKDVTVRVRNSIPDPKFILPAKPKWNGDAPLALRPELTNAIELKASPYSPAFRYQWFLSVNIADTAQSSDSLVLSRPAQDGILEVTLCLDNGGAVSCAATQVAISRLSARLAGRGGSMGAIAMNGGRLLWNRPGRARVWTWQGRLLWEGRGHAGESSELPGPALRALANQNARLEILP